MNGTNTNMRRQSDTIDEDESPNPNLPYQIKQETSIFN